MQNILFDHSVDVVKAEQAAGTTAVESDGVDMSGYESVLFLATGVGTANAGNTFHLQQGADNSADWEDVEGSKVVPGANGDPVAIEVVNPGDRYVRMVATRGVSTTLGGIVAIRRRGRKQPAAHAAELDDNTLVLNGTTEGTP